MTGRTPTPASDQTLFARAVACLTTAISRAGVEPGTASGIANDAADQLFDMWRGRSIYIPNGYYQRIARRNAQIAAAYDGRNLAELAREFQLTETRVRQVVRNERKIRSTTTREEQLS